MFRDVNIDYRGAGKSQSVLSRAVCALGVVMVFALLVAVLLDTPESMWGLLNGVEQNLNRSGVENPVTAVLLNFRAYDTLLEIAVLLIVVVAVLPANARQVKLINYTANADIEPLLAALQRWIAPTTLLVAGYLLWVGAYRPGGAFQAGALLAGAGVLLLQTNEYRIGYNTLPARLLLVLGLLVFTALGLAPILWSAPALTFSPPTAGGLILIIEAAATISIAVSLVLLYQSLVNPTAVGQDVS